MSKHSGDLRGARTVECQLRDEREGYEMSCVNTRSHGARKASVLLSNSASGVK